jgi:hypothetical protein
MRYDSGIFRSWPFLSHYNLGWGVMVGMKNIPWCVPYYCTGQRTMFPVVSGAGTAQQNVRRHMSKDEMISKWHPIDKAALLELSKYTTSPGIHQLGTTALPLQIQSMPGAASYFIDVYADPVNLGNNTIAGGELAVKRTTMSSLAQEMTACISMDLTRTFPSIISHLPRQSRWRICLGIFRNLLRSQSKSWVFLTK